jgi:hypothetical protein
MWQKIEAKPKTAESGLTTGNFGALFITSTKNKCFPDNISIYIYMPTWLDDVDLQDLEHSPNYRP